MAGCSISCEIQYHRTVSGAELELLLLLLLPVGMTCGNVGVVEVCARLAAYIRSCVGGLVGYCAALASSGLAVPAGLGTLVAMFGGDVLNRICASV